LVTVAPGIVVSHAVDAVALQLRETVMGVVAVMKVVAVVSSVAAVVVI